MARRTLTRFIDWVKTAVIMLPLEKPKDHEVKGGAVGFRWRFWI